MPDEQIIAEPAIPRMPTSFGFAEMLRSGLAERACAAAAQA